MINWKEDVFRTFYKGNEKGGVLTKAKIHSPDYCFSYEHWENEPTVCGYLNDGYVDLSCDTKEGSEALHKMNVELNWNLLEIMNPTTEHRHFIGKDPRGIIKSNKGGQHEIIAVGIDEIDIHKGDTSIPLKVNNVERIWIYVPDEIGVFTEECIPVKTDYHLFGMKEHDGRDSTLFSYCSNVLQKKLHLQNSVVKRLARNINKYSYAEPMDDSQVEKIIRDEALEKYEIKPLNSISASDLLNMDIEPVYFAVKDLLPMGLSIIASPPKFGKSYLCTQLSLAVASGSEFLGFDTNRSGVLYMALEDSFNRCKDRLIQELHGHQAPKNLDIMIDCPSLGNGLIEQLQEYVKEHPDTRLIIIDTFQKIRDGSKSNEGAYSSDYREAGLVKKFADQNKIAVLLVHHTRKMKDISDPFANVSGTQGLTGACDTMLVLTKEKRSDDLTKLSITGRDVCQNEYAISRNKDTGLWMRHEESIEQLTDKINIELLKYQYINGNLRKTIFHLLKEKEKWLGRCSEIIEVSKQIGYPIIETSQKLSKILDEVNGFMISEDNIYHSVIQNGTGSKQHRFERSS